MPAPISVTPHLRDPLVQAWRDEQADLAVGRGFRHFRMHEGTEPQAGHFAAGRHTQLFWFHGIEAAKQEALFNVHQIKNNRSIMLCVKLHEHKHNYMVTSSKDNCSQLFVEFYKMKKSCCCFFSKLTYPEKATDQ